MLTAHRVPPSLIGVYEAVYGISGALGVNRNPSSGFPLDCSLARPGYPQVTRLVRKYPCRVPGACALPGKTPGWADQFPSRDRVMAP